MSPPWSARGGVWVPSAAPLLWVTSQGRFECSSTTTRRWATECFVMLAAEPQFPGLAPIVEGGREVHRDWCRRVFAPALEARRGVDRTRLLAQLVAVCDVGTWKNSCAAMPGSAAARWSAP